MDPKYRVYYLVNLNLNYRFAGWWYRDWDNYGHFYRENLHKLKECVPSLKIRPRNPFCGGSSYFQMMISCRKDEERILISTLQKMQKVNYAKINPKTMEVTEVNAKKCDRCGNYYDKNQQTLKPYDGTLSGVAFVRSGNVGNRYIQERDLCDECLEDFKRYLMGAEVKED